MTARSILGTTVLAALLGACGGATDDDTSWLSGGGADNDGGIDIDPEDGADGGAGEGDGGEELDPSCARELFDLSAQPPSVMLVLDKSSSMSDETWLHDGQQVTRWSSLHSVVSDLLGTYDTTIDFGATMFPAIDAGGPNSGFESACRVASNPDVLPSAEATSEILAAMPSASTQVQGATPARAGFATAIQYLGQQPGEQPRAALLITDGLANCADADEMFLYDDLLPQLVGKSYAQLGIPTYVVGIDIRDQLVDYAQANAHEVLQEVASQGGVAREGAVAYYAADDESALDNALDEIAARIECTIALETPVSEWDKVEIVVDDESIAQVGDCSEGPGWRFTDPDTRSTIELCGEACDGLRVTGQVEAIICGDPELDPIPVP